MKLKLGVIGAGKMGEALIAGFQRSKEGKTSTILASCKSESSAKDIATRLKIECGTQNSRVAQESDVIILAVKPSHAEKVCREISGELNSKKLLISICASITLDQLKAWAGDKCAVIRAMPNTPCLIQKGITAFAKGETVSNTQAELAHQIFKQVGECVEVDESLMDGVTGLSGCGPAYVYLIIEALSEGGVKVGLSREISVKLAAQTLLGASQMCLERGIHPAALKDEVTTPAGCTIDGLMALEEGNLRVTLIKGVLAATRRSKTLGGRKD